METTYPFAWVRLRTSNPPKTSQWRETRALGCPFTDYTSCMHTCIIHIYTTTWFIYLLLCMYFFFFFFFTLMYGCIYVCFLFYYLCCFSHSISFLCHFLVLAHLTCKEGKSNLGFFFLSFAFAQPYLISPSLAAFSFRCQI